MKRLFKKYLIISVACSLPFFCGEPTAMAQENNALEAVSTLTVRQTDSVSGYDRDLFQWNKFDEDGDGCDTRNDILARDLDNISKQDKCVVLSGILDDPYTGDRIDFQRGQSTSSKVQIDHIVALSDAWNSGASHWNESKLRAFGNDPYNLAAVDGTANTQKSNSSADEWLPANAAARCLYVATQVGVKEHYALTVTQTEAQKMREVLGSCPTQSIPQSNGSGLVRLVEQNGKTKHGYPFVDQGNVDVDSEVREYRGMSSVIRQDMAAFLYRWAGSPEYTPSNADMHRFRDVDGATPHAKEIWWLASTGISEGWLEPDGSRTFRGMSPVTRQDMAAFMHRLVGDYGPAPSKSIVFSDVDGATPHAKEIWWLAFTGISEGWLEPDGSRTFRGMSPVTRQDMAAFLYRLAGTPNRDLDTDGAFIYSYFRDVNWSTPHAEDIWWLAMKKISTGWIVTSQPSPLPSHPNQVYYKNCAAVRAAGKAPLHRGDPGYRPELDRDNDGIACE